MTTAGTHRIADRYVKALFEVAEEASATKSVEKDFNHLKQALTESEDLRKFIANPLLPEQARAKGMLAILDAINTHQITRQFIGMVLQQKRLDLLPVMIESFEKRAIASRGEIEAQVTSASELKDKDVRALEKTLSDAIGKPVRVTVTHDPELLAGMIVNIGSQQLDASLSGKLRRIGQQLRAA